MGRGTILEKKLSKTKKRISQKKQTTPASPVELPVTTGDMVIDRDGRIFKIGKIKAKKGEIELLSEYTDGNGHYGTWRFTEKSESDRYMRLDKPIETLEAELIKQLQNGFDSFTTESSSSTDLMLTSGRGQVMAAKSALEQKKNQLAVLSALMERKRQDLRNVMESLQTQLKSVRRVVDIIELYMGVNEEIVQITEGDTASVDDPITFRQLVLFMDEEVGDEEGGGLDWRDVDVFDNWMRENYARLIPEKRGVVVARPRRTDKDYRLMDTDPIMHVLMNEPNKDTYILIRNGKCLYRIWTSLKIYPHLFPSREEMAELNSEEVTWPSDKERNEETTLAYKRNVLLMQGLLDRTEVFKPFHEGVHLLKPESYGNHVRFIYDGSSLLSNGRKSWREFLKDINSRVTTGSRVYFAGFPWHLFNKENRAYAMWRFPTYDKGWREKSTPPLPPNGVYNIKDVKAYDKEPTFLCNWKQGGDRWDPKTRSYVDRKAATAFYLALSDNFFINYDELTLEDIEYYLNDRVNRHEYLDMMPVLRGIKKMRLKELEAEKNFVRFICGKLGSQDQVLEKKVIEKRPLTKEDAKAVRMILTRVKSNT
jgi:uncharacterized FlaG/YvyC family protein